MDAAGLNHFRAKKFAPWGFRDSLTLALAEVPRKVSNRSTIRPSDNPTEVASSTSSASSRAPPIHAAQRSASLRDFCDSSSWMTMSARWSRPPDRSTRAISRNATFLSGVRLITPLEVTTSMLPLSTGSPSAHTTLIEGRRTVEVTLAIDESARTGEAIKLSGI